MELLFKGVFFIFIIRELEVGVFEFLSELLVVEFELVDFILEEGVVVFEMDNFVVFD